MADEFRVVISGDDELDRRIGRLSLFLQDLRSFWPLVVPVVTGWWRSQFESEGAFAGRPWAPLNPDYLARKQAMGLRTEILQATGALRQAASQPSREATARSLTLTISDPKLQYLQEGTAKMPARPLVFGSPLPPQAEQQLGEVAAAYVRDLLERF